MIMIQMARAWGVARAPGAIAVVAGPLAPAQPLAAGQHRRPSAIAEHNQTPHCPARRHGGLVIQLGEPDAPCQNRHLALQ